MVHVLLEKKVLGGKNKVRGGANTWVSVQQGKRFFSAVEEKKVSASLGVPESKVWDSNLVSSLRLLAGQQDLQTNQGTAPPTTP